MKRILAILILLIFSGKLFAVDGYEEYKFGLSFDEVKKLSQCDWKKQDPTIRQLMIIPSKRLSMYKCIDFPYENRKIEFYAEFFDDILKRVILDISSNEKNNQAKLKLLKETYGFKNGKLKENDRSKVYLFDDQTVEVEIWDPPIDLMFIRFSTEDYKELQRKVFLKDLPKIKT